MADTGWKFPGTMVGNRTVAGSDADWTNQDNAKADDTSDAVCTLAVSGDISSGLAASNFDFSVIPAGAQIDGIEIRVGDYSTDGTAAVWNQTRLILADNSDGSEQKASQLQSLVSTDRTDEAGGSNDLWNETLTRAVVQDVDFGFFVAVGIASGAPTESQVDFMQMRVFYHLGLPTTIVSEAGVKGHSPPFKSSGGNFYVIAITDVLNKAIDAYKATDPTDSFTVQDAANNPTEGGSVGYEHIAVFQKGDVLHIASVNSFIGTIIYKYHSFNMADDTWGTVNETIEDVSSDPPTEQWISIAVRSNGDVVVVYNGATDQVMGGSKERVDVNIRNGSWGGPVALEVDDGADEHYGNPNVVKGPLTDDMHILWQQTVDTADPPIRWQRVEARTLRPSDDSLSTLDFASAVDTEDVLLGLQNGVSYDDAGTQRMIWAGVRNAIIEATSRVFFPATEDGFDDIVLGTLIADVTEPDPFENGEVGIISIAELNGDLHVLFSGGGSNGVDQDLHYTTSTDDGATWTTPTEEIDGITCNFISANIYMRSIDTMLAYVYDDNGVQKYNEKVLVVGVPFPYHQVVTARRKPMAVLLTL